MQFEMSKIKQDTICANKTTICFKTIMSLSLIYIVQIPIFDGTTNFYIVNILLPFFHYLKNIDILDIYYNNTINQFICQNGKNILIFADENRIGFLSIKRTK